MTQPTSIVFSQLFFAILSLSAVDIRIFIKLGALEP